MAESTLGITYTELVYAVAHYLGILPVATLTDTETTSINMVISSALRQFYFPPPVLEDGRTIQTPHEWSFLKPITTLDTIAPYSTGTIAITITETTVTLSDGTWPSWAATHGSLVVDTAEYVIASRTSGSEIELDSAWTADTETAAEFTLKHDGNYDLPDDFGGVEGRFVIESENYKPDMVLVGEGRIRSLRQTSPQNINSGSTTTPYYVAVRPKTQTDTTTGQRFEIMFFPLPNAVLTISYMMRVLPQMLVTTTIEYPYGGTMHAETLRAACIAAAEEQENNNRRDGNRTYDKRDLFKERLAASIALDKQMNQVTFYGYNADNSDARHREGPYSRNDRRRCGGYPDNSLVTYNNSIT